MSRRCNIWPDISISLFFLCGWMCKQPTGTTEHPKGRLWAAGHPVLLQYSFQEREKQTCCDKSSLVSQYGENLLLTPCTFPAPSHIFKIFFLIPQSAFRNSLHSLFIHSLSFILSARSLYLAPYHFPLGQQMYFGQSALTSFHVTSSYPFSFLIKFKTESSFSNGNSYKRTTTRSSGRRLMAPPAGERCLRSRIRLLDSGKTNS